MVNPMKKPSDRPVSCSSPPCFAHELQFGEDGFEAVDAATAADVARWRKAQRERLLAARQAISAPDRKKRAAGVMAELEQLINPRPGQTIAVYWPIKGELNLRPWLHWVADLGARVALPVVEERGRPLVFREWSATGRMERGIWNIPVPADGKPVTPDIVIAPLVGADADCYRLGYGGGYFDHTLAALSPRPQAIGVGYPNCIIPTIYPQPHDIPMDLIVTGSGEPTRRCER